MRSREPFPGMGGCCGSRVSVGVGGVWWRLPLRVNTIECPSADRQVTAMGEWSVGATTHSTLMRLPSGVVGASAGQVRVPR